MFRHSLISILRCYWREEKQRLTVDVLEMNQFEVDGDGDEEQGLSNLAYREKNDVDIYE